MWGGLSDYLKVTELVNYLAQAVRFNLLPPITPYAAQAPSKQGPCPLFLPPSGKTNPIPSTSKTSLPFSGSSSRIPDPVPSSKRPQHEALSSQKQARIRTQVWPFPCARLHPCIAETFPSSRHGLAATLPRRVSPFLEGGGAQGAAASRVPSLYAARPGSLSHRRHARRLDTPAQSPGLLLFLHDGI